MISGEGIYPILRILFILLYFTSANSVIPLKLGNKVHVQKAGMV
jgi:hypothetical protein